MPDDKKYVNRFIMPNGEEVYIRGSGGAGGEVGDIGIAPLGVDETKNTRRILNGQIIMASDFPALTQLLQQKQQSGASSLVGMRMDSFPGVIQATLSTTSINEEQNTNSHTPKVTVPTTSPVMTNLFCTEEEWQAAKAASAYGQVGKFVLNYATEEHTEIWAVYNYVDVIGDSGTTYRVVKKPADTVAVGDIAYDWNNETKTITNPTGYTITGIANSAVYGKQISFEPGGTTKRWNNNNGEDDYTNTVEIPTNTVESIRLPAVVNIQGVLDLSNAGLTVAAGLPNITGTSNSFFTWDLQSSGAIKQISAPSRPTGGGNDSVFSCIDFNASRSNSIYGNSDTVQQEAIQYPYYIIVATEAEEQEPIINSYTVTSAYSFGMSQYYNGVMNNNSWLRSEGQWNSSAIYPSLYNWIVEQTQNGVDGFKGIGYAYSTADSSLSCWITSTIPAVGQTVYGYSPIRAIGKIESLITNGFVFTDDTSTQRTVTRNNTHDAPITDTNWINDYDWVINTADSTFRLPLLDGSEDLPGSESVLITANYTSGQQIVAPYNGIYTIHTNYNANNQLTNYNLGGGTALANVVQNSLGTTTGQTSLEGVHLKHGQSLTIITTSTTSVAKPIYCFKDTGNGSLYYYCGNVEQNAELINSARVREQLVDIQAKYPGAAFPSDKYIDLTLGASGSTYTAPANGWVYVEGISTGNYGYFNLANTSAGSLTFSLQKPAAGQAGGGYIPVHKGDTFTLHYHVFNIGMLRFIYAQGAQGGS